MAHKKRNKYPSHSKVLSDAKRYVIKAGEYNGSSDSSDFMVTGHSTGSPYSEMEELSEQLTRDVGGLPYKPVEFGDDQSETGYDLYQGEGLGDLGGPEFYGDKPSLLKKSPVHKAGTSRGLAIGAAIGLAATAILGGLAYAFYESSKDEHSSARSARGLRRNAGSSKTQHQVAAAPTGLSSAKRGSRSRKSAAPVAKSVATSVATSRVKSRSTKSRSTSARSD